MSQPTETQLAAILEDLLSIPSGWLNAGAFE